MYVLLFLLLLSGSAVVVYSFDLDHDGSSKNKKMMNDDNNEILVENMILDPLFVRGGSQRKRSKRRRLENFAPTKSCGETLGYAKTYEIGALANLVLDELFPNPEDAGLKQIASSLLVSQVVYDLKIVKVCMSCHEAKSILPDDIATISSGNQFEFSNFCGDDMYGFNQIESSIALIPVDPTIVTSPSEVDNNNYQEILSGSRMRGFVYGRGFTISIDDCPSENPMLQNNWTQYIAETETDDILREQLFLLVPALFSGVGAVSIIPDFLGYGESFKVDRPFLSKQFYARSYVLGWLAAREYIRQETLGCSDLEPVVSVSGYSEGGYSTIPGALALKTIGVDVLASYSGGAMFQPGKQLSYIMDFLSDSTIGDPDLQTALGLYGTYYAYSLSNEFPFLANTGSGQFALADAYQQGDDIETNVLLWFKAPEPQMIEYGEVFPFLPPNPDEILSLFNPDLVALYDEARALGYDDACNSEISSTETSKLCEAVNEQSMIPELELVDFPTIICHSRDDEVVTFKNAPYFPSANSFVSNYTGIPDLNILAPEGSHFQGALYCGISPIVGLQLNMGDNSPAKTTPMELCLDQYRACSTATDETSCRINQNDCFWCQQGDDGIGDVCRDSQHDCPGQGNPCFGMVGDDCESNRCLWCEEQGGQGICTSSRGNDGQCPGNVVGPDSECLFLADESTCTFNLSCRWCGGNSICKDARSFCDDGSVGIRGDPCKDAESQSSCPSGCLWCSPKSECQKPTDRECLFDTSSGDYNLCQLLDVEPDCNATSELCQWCELQSRCEVSEATCGTARGEVGIEFGDIGKRAMFSIQDDGLGATDPNAVSLSLESVLEVAEGGAYIAPSFIDFAFKEFTYTQSVGQFFSGSDILARRINFESVIGGVGKIEVVAFLMMKNGTITTEAGEAWSVGRGDVKFNIRLSNWTFCDATTSPCGDSNVTSEFIDVAVKIKGRYDVPDPSAVSNLLFNLGGGVPLELSDQVVTDAFRQDMPEGYPRVVNSEGQGPVFVFRFPRFIDAMEYDPIIGFHEALMVVDSATSEPTDTMAPSSALASNVTAAPSFSPSNEREGGEPSSSGNDGLSVRAIIGMVVGALVFVCCCCAVATIIAKKNSSSHQQARKDVDDNVNSMDGFDDERLLDDNDGIQNKPTKSDECGGLSDVGEEDDNSNETDEEDEDGEEDKYFGTDDSVKSEDSEFDGDGSQVVFSDTDYSGDAV